MACSTCAAIHALWCSVLLGLVGLASFRLLGANSSRLCVQNDRPPNHSSTLLRLLIRSLLATLPSRTARSARAKRTTHTAQHESRV